MLFSSTVSWTISKEKPHMKKEINVVAKYMVDLFNSNVKCCRIKCLKADNLSIYLTHNWQLLTMQYLLRIAHNAHCAMAGASGSCPYNMYDMVGAGPSCEECRQTRPRSASVWAPVERAGWRTLWRIGGELVLLPHSAMTNVDTGSYTYRCYYVDTAVDMTCHVAVAGHVLTCPAVWHLDIGRQHDGTLRQGTFFRKCRKCLMGVI